MPKNFMTIANILGSFLAGLVVATGIVWFSPIEDIPKARVETDEKVKETLQKSPHLRKFFGVSDEDMSEQKSSDENIADATKSILSENYDQQILEDASVDDPIFKVRFALSVVVCCGGIYAANIVSNGDFGRFICGMFPVETEALKIKSWLERW